MAKGNLLDPFRLRTFHQQDFGDRLSVLFHDRPRILMSTYLQRHRRLLYLHDQLGGNMEGSRPTAMLQPPDLIY